MDKSSEETATRRSEPLAVLADAASDYASREGLVPPLSSEELTLHAELLLARRPDLDASVVSVAVFINNALWTPTVANVPFDRRILLLPQCLKNESSCQADADEFGLLCEKCQGCSMGGFHEEAERLGYVVLVAEGTTVVRRLVEGGKIDAVIGVSCEDALMKAFPHMASGAIPGLAVPLRGGGCRNTTVDEAMVRRYIHMGEPPSRASWVDMDSVKGRVDAWFSPDSLRRIFGLAGDGASFGRGVAEIALEWMAVSGKRLRPALTVAVAEALDGNGSGMEARLEPLAVAVECFHKASLAHDDIEDDDAERYGRPTLHLEWGVPVALNAGDFLVGEGYRLISGARYPAETRVAMLEMASECHRALCAGQGDELLALRSKALPLSVAETLEIFRGKTSPAFHAAIVLGALSAGAGMGLIRTLRSFSDALGIAYQIKDDMDDWSEPSGERVPSLSILASIVGEFGDADERKSVTGWLGGDAARRASAASAIRAPWVSERAERLLAHHRNEALRAVSLLNVPPLESLLRKFVARLFPGIPPRNVSKTD